MTSLAAAILLFDWIRFGRGRRLSAEAFAVSDVEAREGLR